MARIPKAPRKPVDPGDIAAAVQRIDLTELEEMAAIGCTKAEAAQWFSVLPRVFNAALKEEILYATWRRGVGKGLVRLRRAQFDLAEKNATMAALLGKRLLGQGTDGGAGGSTAGGPVTIVVDTGIQRDDDDTN